jgi:ABC-type sulfate/molybdate transport systems ATPase subunit
MFADEPTGNLDSTTSGEILALLRDSVDELGQTTVMVTHDAHAAAIADRVLFLADGEIVSTRGPRRRDPRRGRRRHLRGAGASQPGRGPAAGRGPDGGQAGSLRRSTA